MSARAAPALRLLMTADALGGVWQYATDLARALRPLGIEATLAVLGPAPSPAQLAAADGVRVIATGLPLDWLAPDAAAVRAAARAIADLARAERVDLVQLNQPALAAEWGSVPVPAPVVVAVHSCVATWWAAVEGGPLPAAFAWQTALVRAGLAAADAVVCPSTAFAEAVHRAYALPAAPAVVANGRRPLAVPQSPSPPPDAHRRDFAFFAGRLWDRAKDAATLDRAAARLSVPLELAGPLVGANGEAATLRHARALGALDEAALAARLAERPVFVSAARYEPFGLAVLEAAQAGCPLVLADIPTFRELWNGVARFVAPGDAEGFAAAIDALVADPVAHAAAGAAARTRAARYTPDATAAGMAALYARALGRRVAAPGDVAGRAAA